MLCSPKLTKILIDWVENWKFRRAKSTISSKARSQEFCALQNAKIRSNPTCLVALHRFPTSFPGIKICCWVTSMISAFSFISVLLSFFIFFVFRNRRWHSQILDYPRNTQRVHFKQSKQNYRIVSSKRVINNTPSNSTVLYCLFLAELFHHPKTLQSQ